METTMVLTAGLTVLAVISGMPGPGVAFAAIPFLGLFLPDLVNQVQPLSLLLNGVTALSSALRQIQKQATEVQVAYFGGSPWMKEPKN